MRLSCSVAMTVLVLSVVSPVAADESSDTEIESAESPRDAKRRGAARRDETPDKDDAPDKKAASRKRPISVGLLLGYGHSFQEETVNPWGVGFGARGGYNLGGLFLGARFVFYLGHEPSSIWELGLETGYDLKAGIFTARPALGLGIASLSVEMGPTTMDSETEVYFAPGLTLLLDVARDVFIGAEGRVQMIFSEPGRQALIALGNVGLRF